MRLALLAVMALVLLAGCGGDKGGDDDAEAQGSGKVVPSNSNIPSDGGGDGSGDDDPILDPDDDDDDIVEVEYGFDISDVTGQPTEAGGLATFTVALLTKPSSSVTVALTSSDLTEGTVSPATLTFTSDDWNTAQTVTVTGVDDANYDVLTAFSVAIASTSSDANYSGIDAESVALTNVDDEPASVSYVLTSGTSHVMVQGYTKVKVWVIGGGGGGASDAAGGGGGAGGVSYKTWTGLSDGTTINFALGAAGLGAAAGMAGATGGDTTATVDGVTITATGGVGGTLDSSNAAGGSFSGGDGGAAGGFGYGVVNQDQGGGGGGGIGGNPGTGYGSGSDGGNGGVFSDVADLGAILAEHGYDLLLAGIGGNGADDPDGYGGSASGFGCGGGGAGWYGGPGGNGLFGGGGGGGASESTIGTGGDGGAGVVVLHVYN